MFLEDKSKTAGAEAKADPFSLDALIAWLEKQPAAKTYNYTCNGHCLVSQYLNASGVPCAGVVPYGYREGEARIYKDFPDSFEQIAIGKPRSFGAALSRALSIKESGNV